MCPPLKNPDHSLRGIVGCFIHLVLVMALCGNAKAASIFFAMTAVLVLAKPHIPARLQKLYLPGAIVTIVFSTLWFRQVSLLGEIPIDYLKPLVWRNLTFVGISYVFLRVVQALVLPYTWTLLSYARYFFFFPTFFSGPILEPNHMPVNDKILDPAGVQPGLSRVINGIARIGGSYLLLAYIPLGTARQFYWGIDNWSILALWCGVFVSGFWLYLNFSGFSEIYIGLSRVFGVRAPENFDNPYSATDLPAFWQRWHISLGSWLRNLVYTPLSRRMMRLPYMNDMLPALIAPMITMIICGVWHEPVTRFLLWGLMHGIGLAACVLWGSYVRPSIPIKWRSHAFYRCFGWITTHAYITLTWVFFLPLDSGIPLESRLSLFLALVGAKS